MLAPYVEQDCTFTFGGKAFTSGGAFVSEKYITGYCSDDMKRLHTWHGEDLGTLKVVSWWRLPLSCWVSDRMYQVEATVDGVVYTGRTTGGGMIARLKRKANQ
jgi:hypothetical protein